MIASGACILYGGIHFFFFNVLDGFSGGLIFDHRNMGDFFLVEGIINCYFNFVVVLLLFVAALLLSPIVQFFKEFVGCPVILVVGASLGQVGHP
jgi:hypothetical protein